MKLRVTFDRSANAAYIYLKEIEPGAAVRQELCDEGGTIILDFDQHDRLIGIEVLDATRRLPLNVIHGAERL